MAVRVRRRSGSHLAFSPPVPARAASSVNSQMATAQRISKMEQDIDARQQQVNTLLQEYVGEGGQDLGTLVGRV